MELQDLFKCYAGLRVELRLGARALFIYKVEATRHGCAIVFNTGLEDERMRAEFRVPGVLHRLTKFLG